MFFSTPSCSPNTSRAQIFRFLASSSGLLGRPPHGLWSPGLSPGSSRRPPQRGGTPRARALDVGRPPATRFEPSIELLGSGHQVRHAFQLLFRSKSWQGQLEKNVDFFLDANKKGICKHKTCVTIYIYLYLYLSINR